MNPRRAIPLPRRLAREKGRPGIDRPPLRLYRTGPKFCPRHAFWVGEGSEFANPFCAKAPEIRGLVTAFERFARADRREKWNPVVNKHELPRATPEQISFAVVALHRRWLAGELADDRGQPLRLKPVRNWLDVFEVPTPPAAARIREALAGRDLVDSTPDRWPSHADELLRIANTAEEKVDG